MTIVFPPISKLAKFHFYTCSLLSSLHTYIFYSKALNSFIHIRYKKVFKIIFISNWFLTILLSSLTSPILINNTHSNLLKNHSLSSNSQFNQLNLPQILISLSLYICIYIYPRNISISYSITKNIMRGLAQPCDTSVYMYIFNVARRTRTPFTFHYGERLTKQRGGEGGDPLLLSSSATEATTAARHATAAR